MNNQSMNFSYSGQHSGWHDYAATDWASRKPLDWLDDWPFWRYCAEKFAGDGPILELACGNGRITRQLLLNGYTVVAVDINPHFLNHALQVIPDEYRTSVDFHLADVVMLDLDQQFQLAIMADWAFPALLTQADQRQFLTRLAKNLMPGGLFAFNTPLGSTRQIGLVQTDDGLQWTDDPTRRFDALTQVETKQSGSQTIRLRHNTLDEIQLLAELADFKIIEQYGNVDRRPLRGVAGDDLTLILQKTP